MSMVYPTTPGESRDRGSMLSGSTPLSHVQGSGKEGKRKEKDLMDAEAASYRAPQVATTAKKGLNETNSVIGLNDEQMSHEDEGGFNFAKKAYEA